MHWIPTQLNLHKIIFFLHGEKASLSIHLTYIAGPYQRIFLQNNVHKLTNMKQEKDVIKYSATVGIYTVQCIHEVSTLSIPKPSNGHNHMAVPLSSNSHKIFFYDLPQDLHGLPNFKCPTTPAFPDQTHQKNMYSAYYLHYLMHMFSSLH